MSVYYYFIAFTACVLLLLLGTKGGGRAVIYGLWLGVFVVIVGFRWDVGTDFYNYMMLFYETEGFLSYKEPLFVSLILVTRLFFQYDVFLFVCTLLACILVYVFARKILPRWGYEATVIILMGMFVTMISGFRVAIAGGFVLLALGYRVHRDDMVSWFFLILGILTHYAALIYVPIFLTKDNSVKMLLVVTVLILVIAYVSSESVVLRGLLEESSVGGGYSGYVFDKFYSYSYEKESHDKIIGLTTGIKKMSLLAYFFYWRRRMLTVFPGYDYLFYPVVLGYLLHMTLGFTSYAFSKLKSLASSPHVTAITSV